MTDITTMHDTPGGAIDARQLARNLSKYREPHAGRSAFELGVTIGPFVILWILMWMSLEWSYWLSLLLAIPTAAFLVRLFMIQHDCGHGAFLGRRASNDWVGRALSVLTFTPYDYWRRSHAIHHATSGNLDQRGIGDINTLTVREYLALPWWGRLGYRIYRHPITMFGFGPAYLFILQFRLPIGLMRKGWQPWLSTMATNVMIGLIAGVMIWAVGFTDFLAVQIPIIVFAASAGVWLFFVQHQFDETSWASNEQWDVHRLALHGSSHYDLPPVLRWLTANIGMHHVHHLSSRIPFYRLPQVLRDHPELSSVGRLTPLESLKCVRLVLWDEADQRLIPFSELRSRVAAA